MKQAAFALSLLVCIVGISSCGSLSEKLPASSRKISAPGFVNVNEDNPGQQTNIKSSIVFGKYTIIEFTSPYCGACMQMKPLLEALPEKRQDIVVRSFDVNRKEAMGVDFESPLAQQYEIHVLPSFKIFNDKGRQIADGSAARDQVRDLIEKELMQAER